MHKEYQDALQTLVKTYEQSGYDDHLQDEREAMYDRVMASIEALETIDYIALSYMEELGAKLDLGQTLIRIFGLLQGLFVSIDALYDLSKGMTKNKWSVNVNQNKALHEIKFIRNDVVGHPTNRTYEPGRIGYAILDRETSNLSTLEYKVNTYLKGKKKVNSRTVNLPDVMDQYFEEATKILIEIETRMNKENAIREGVKGLSCLVYDLYLAYIEGNLDYTLVREIKTLFLERYNIKEDSQNRFLWRIRIIEALFDYENERTDFLDVIEHTIKHQLKKLFEMAAEIDESSLCEVSKSSFKREKLPTAITYFYRFVKNNEAMFYPHTQVMHDQFHPLYEGAISAFQAANKQHPILRPFFDWLVSIRELEEVCFAVGSLLKQYQKK